MNTIDELIKIVIGAAYKIYNTLGGGFLEKVYEKALIIELKERGMLVEHQTPINVIYKGKVVGDYYADLLINKKLIVELKSVEELNIIHEKQLVNYLVATEIDDGLLINFGPTTVKIKRKFRIYRKGNKNL